MSISITVGCGGEKDDGGDDDDDDGHDGHDGSEYDISYMCIFLCSCCESPTAQGQRVRSALELEHWLVPCPRP